LRRVRRLDHGVPGQVSRPDQSGIVTEAGKHQPGLLTEPAARQRTAEGPLRRLQEQITCSAHSPADNDNLGIQGSGKIRDSLA
jgi:hypothetical protein